MSTITFMLNMDSLEINLLVLIFSKYEKFMVFSKDKNLPY